PSEASATRLPFFIMPFVEGESLRARLSRGPLSVREAVSILKDVSRALVYAHGRGIIHRDIKPDNILVGNDRKVKITDMGLAKQTDDPELNRLTATGMVVGTPLYVSPEAIRDPRTCTTAADIYSLGATLYHLLVGHPPFQADSPYEVMRAHLERRPQPIRELRSDVPTGLAQLVDRCLSKTPERRPTALQLAELLSGGANLKASASRGLATLVGIATVVVLGGAVLGWFGLQHLRHAQVEATATASLTVNSLHADAELRIDEGPWHPLSAGAQRLAPGTHRLEVRADRSGPLLRYLGEVTLTDQQQLVLPVTLAPVMVPQTRIPVAGEGMLYADGVAFGTDPVYTVTQAGTFALGRWDGQRWQTCTATVDERGQAAAGAMITRDRPDGGAWWRTMLDSGVRIFCHHVASWWEITARAMAPAWRRHPVGCSKVNAASSLPWA
ncbi:MAG TPA: serine/threonine-protein kinase, partial [Planctomycetota bacterium]|nr:serine/threonine-protein kinase [Planctomycetota bacterium]